MDWRWITCGLRVDSGVGWRWIGGVLEVGWRWVGGGLSDSRVCILVLAVLIFSQENIRFCIFSPT